MDEEQLKEALSDDIAPEVIDRAKGMGWIPEEEFKGDKARWTPADKYVERAETLQPIMKAQMRKYEEKLTSQSRQLEELNSTLASQKETTEKIIKMGDKVQEEAYNRAKRELTQKQVQAVSDGDVDAWQKIEDQKEGLVKPEPTVVEPVQQQNQTMPGFKEWHDDNDWYLKDEDLTRYANAYSDEIKQTSPNLTYSQHLEAVEKKTKEAFKSKFENQNRKAASAVTEGGISGGDTGSRNKSFNDLPADAKAQCKKYVSEGLFKDNAAYVESYFEEEE